MNKTVITEYNKKVIIVFIRDDKTVKIRALDNVYEYTKTVYLGRITNVKSNISSSFVRYGNGLTGFIGTNKYKPETVLPVMVKKHTPKGKEDVLTDKIVLSGLYCVTGDGINGINISKKLSSFDTGEYEFNDVIIRTNALNTDTESVYNEYKYLKDCLDKIKNTYDKRTENTILYNGILSLADVVFSENTGDYDEILTDIPDVYSLLTGLRDDYKNKGIYINIPIRLYDDASVPLNALISLSSKLDDALGRKVYLKSDAQLVIDHTEAMTVIDVNSSNTRFKGDKASVIHNINMEAAGEVARQLKLRNLSGIIIVDFINEQNEDYKKELSDHIIKCLKDDDCSAKFHGLTSLGLGEITRVRREQPLWEQMK